MPRTRPASLLLLAALAAASPAAAQEIRMAYSVSGTGLDGAAYTGTVEIISGTSGPQDCRIEWRTPDPVGGICMVHGPQLVAFFSSGNQYGLALYTADGKGGLNGVWSVAGLAGKGTEVLSPTGASATAAGQASAGQAAAGQAAAAPPAAVPDLAALDAEGRAMLRRFFDPGADLHALTAALRPRPEDVRAVYAEPLASRLIEATDAAFAGTPAIGPKPGQDELLFFITTTGELRRGGAALDEFPGGYKDVLPHFVADVPIVRFKFVTRGETLGLAFDGLVHVNGRWVLIPKPWRSL